jgi:hypothetical protein
MKGKQGVFGAVNLREDHKSGLEAGRIVIQRHDNTADGGLDVKLSETEFMARATDYC